MTPGIMILTAIFGILCFVIGYRIGDSVGKARGDLYSSFFLTEIINRVSKEAALEVRNEGRKLIASDELYKLYQEYLKQRLGVKK